jgi:hypothetical protein
MAKGSCTIGVVRMCLLDRKCCWWTGGALLSRASASATVATYTVAKTELPHTTHRSAGMLVELRTSLTARYLDMLFAAAASLCRSSILLLSEPEAML